MQILAHAATISAAALIFTGAQAPPIQKHSQPVQKPAIVEKAEKPTPTSEPKPKIVTVERGDTLSSIATASQTTWRRIYDKNTEISNPDLIYPDDKLVIPANDEKLAHRPLPANTTSAAPSTPTTIGQTTNNQIETASYKQTAVPAEPATTSGSAWDRLAGCESSGNWSANTGNGFYGGLQFTLESWRAVGGSGLPSNASRAEQIMRAEKLQSIQGWGAWPVCSVKAGLR